MAALLTTAASSCKKDKSATPESPVQVFTATGDITATVNEFRQLLGEHLNNQPNNAGGRREIDWDGIPDSLIGEPLPADFFNPVGNTAPAGRQRGLVYSSTGTFMVSDNNFATINVEASSEFQTFSGKRAFANVSSNLWEVNPKKPGTAIDGTIRGFGIVFSDVDKPNSTSIEFFQEEKSLGKFFVPARNTTSSFSFLGVYFNKDKVTKVRVQHDGFLAANEKDISQGGAHDLVILDDFIYDEPIARQ